MTDPGTAPAQDIAQATAQLHAQHRLETSPLQQSVDRLTAWVRWPGFVASLGAVMAIWITGNLLAARLGFRPLDPPPFSWLQGASSVGALVVAALILATQRREDELANHRAQLILELSVLNDQKISKIIGLLEEHRRDNPAIEDRVDEEAEVMATPADTGAVLGAIKEVQQGLERGGEPSLDEPEDAAGPRNR